MEIIKKRRIYIFKNYALLNKYKKEKKGLGYFTSDIEMYTFDTFVRHEIELFWPLLFDEIRPTIIDRRSSIFMLKQIIEKMSIVDGRFLYFNARDVKIAERIYLLMVDSEKSGIPIEDMYPRIIEFKSKKDRDIYSEINLAVEEYKTILEKARVIDIPMIYSMYNRLLKNDRYKKELERIDFINVDFDGRFIFNNIEVSSLLNPNDRRIINLLKRCISQDTATKLLNNVNEDIATSEGDYELEYKTPLSEIDNKLDGNAFISGRNSDFKTVIEKREFNTYFDMIIDLEKFLIDESRCIVCLPYITKDIEILNNNLREKGIRSSIIRQGDAIGYNDVVLASVAAFKLLCKKYYTTRGSGFYSIDKDPSVTDFDRDMYVELVMFIYRNKIDELEGFSVNGSINYFIVRKRLNEIINYILENDILYGVNMFKNSRSFGEFVPVSKYIKYFYKNCSVLNESNARMISLLCDDFEEIINIYHPEIRYSCEEFFDDDVNMDEYYQSLDMQENGVMDENTTEESVQRINCKKESVVDEDDVMNFYEEIVKFSLDVLDYLLKNTNEIASAKSRDELFRFNDICFMRLEDYLNFPYDSDTLVVFDYLSSRYNVKIEDFMNTKLAYLSDNVIEKLREIYRCIIDHALYKKASVDKEHCELGIDFCNEHNEEKYLQGSRSFLKLDEVILDELISVYSNILELDRFFMFSDRIRVSMVKKVLYLGSYLSISGYDQDGRMKVLGGDLGDSF